MGLFDRFRRRPSGGPAAVRARLEGAMAQRRLRGWNPPLAPDGRRPVAPFDRRDALFTLLMLMDRERPGGRRLASLDGHQGRQRLAVICEALER